MHNEIVRRRPDLARLLAGPWFMDRKGEVPEGKKGYFELPVFNYHEVSIQPSLDVLFVCSHATAAVCGDGSCSSDSLSLTTHGHFGIRHVSVSVLLEDSTEFIETSPSCATVACGK